MRRSGVRFLATGAAVVALLLAGCSGDGEAEPRKPDSSSAAATPTPTPTGPVEPTLPPEAQGEDAAAAEAFVRHYWAVVNYAQESGDVDALARLAAESCGACRGGTDWLRDVFAQGGTIQGGAYSVDKAVQVERLTAGDRILYEVEVTVSNEAQQVTGTNDLDKRYPAKTGRATFVVVPPSSGGWLVTRWEATQ